MTDIELLAHAIDSLRVSGTICFMIWAWFKF